MSDSSMTLVSLLIILLMFAGVARGRMKRFNPIGIWLLPVLFLFMTAEEVLQLSLPTPAAQLASALALTLGGTLGLGVGLLRGRTMRFSRDAQGFLYRNSYATVAFYAAVILVKCGGRLFFAQSTVASLLSLGLLALSCGSVVGRRGFIVYKAARVG